VKIIPVNLGKVKTIRMRKHIFNLQYLVSLAEKLSPNKKKEEPEHLRATEIAASA
jgi:hypothetical protein